MRSVKGQAEPRRATWNCWRPDRHGPKAWLAQASAHSECCFGGAEDDGHDLGRGRAGAEADRASPFAEALRKACNVCALGIHARNGIECGVDRAKHGRWQSGRIDEARAAIDEIVAHRLRAGDIAAV